MVIRGRGQFLVSALRPGNNNYDFARFFAATSDDRSGNQTIATNPPQIAKDLPQISELEDLNNAIVSPIAENKRLQALELEYEYLKFTGEPVPKVVTEHMNQMVGE